MNELPENETFQIAIYYFHSRKDESDFYLVYYSFIILIWILMDRGGRLSRGSNLKT